MGERHHIYVWCDGSSKHGCEGQTSILQIHLGSDVLERICSQQKEATVTYLRTHVRYEADGGVLKKRREHHEEARHEIYVDALQIGDLRQRRVRARYKGRHR